MTKRVGRGRRPQGTPAVVFVDDCKWNAFHQLAPGLRRAGVRTIRISTEGLRKTRVTSRLLFDRYEALPHSSSPSTLRVILAQENVVDVQFAESLAGWVGEATDALRPAVAEQVRRRIAVVDKVVASRLFSQAGVPTPAIIPAAETSAEHVAERFGFPVVVKAAIGFGGKRVTIAHDLDELEAATSNGSGEPGELFYEQFVVGRKLNYAAALGPDGVEQELAYEVVRWNRPVGRASVVETIDDAQLVEFGRKALDVAGCTGLVNMDVIRDGQGVDWLIDFNPRAFGGSGSFRAAGIDTSEGYLRVIGARSTPPERSNPVIGVRIRVFPTYLEDVIDTGQITRSTLAFLRGSIPYIRWLGFRYWLSEALLTADSVHEARQLRARVAPAAVPLAPTEPSLPHVPMR